MDKTKIEWADATWNPVTGCFHGCEYCYARGIAQRFGGVKIGHFNGQICELEEPYRRALDGSINPYPYEFMPTFHRYRLDQPRKWTKPRTIFVCSMADLFGEWVPIGWIAAVFDSCREAPQHRYLFLTKNPQRYQSLAYMGKLPEADNFWYGSTATGPYKPLFYSDRHHTFVSYEPILESFGMPDDPERCAAACTDWAILGAESGNRKDKVTPKAEWIEDITREYRKRGKPVFMKDSLIPIIGEANMLRQFPWDREERT